jgi:hypothetical protein
MGTGFQAGTYLFPLTHLFSMRNSFPLFFHCIKKTVTFVSMNNVKHAPAYYYLPWKNGKPEAYALN